MPARASFPHSTTLHSVTDPRSSTEGPPIVPGSRVVEALYQAQKAILQKQSRLNAVDAGDMRFSSVRLPTSLLIVVLATRICDSAGGNPGAIAPHRESLTRALSLGVSLFRLWALNFSSLKASRGCRGGPRPSVPFHAVVVPLQDEIRYTAIHGLMTGGSLAECSRPC